MTTLEKTTEEKRSMILELIGLMTNKNISEFDREGYHMKCYLCIEEYSGNDFNKIANKFLFAESQMARLY